MLENSPERNSLGVAEENRWTGRDRPSSRKAKHSSMRATIDLVRISNPGFMQPPQILWKNGVQRSACIPLIFSSLLTIQVLCRLTGTGGHHVPFPPDPDRICGRHFGHRSQSLSPSVRIVVKSWIGLCWRDDAAAAFRAFSDAPARWER